MGFWEWMGFENPRDSPKTEQPKEGLPKVTDNVRDSGQTFVFGRSNAGEQVDEKAAMQIPTVYACVRLLAESIAALPLHLYRVTDDTIQDTVLNFNQLFNNQPLQVHWLNIKFQPIFLNTQKNPAVVFHNRFLILHLHVLQQLLLFPRHLSDSHIHSQAERCKCIRKSSGFLPDLPSTLLP